MIPPKPNGSWIKEHITPDTWTLTWRLPTSGGMSHLVSILGGLVVAGVVFSQAIWRLPRQGDLWPWLVVLVPLVFLVPMLRLLRRPRPESITLGADSFRHELGR